MTTDLDRYLDHVFGDARCCVLVCTNGPRGWDEGTLVPYGPTTRPTIAAAIERAVAGGLDVYMAAHGYLDHTRPAQKPNAAPLSCLWVEADAAPLPTGDLAPTMVVETSPGRTHAYWRLARPVAPEIGERLNRRLTRLIGGDAGWALTKRLRPPGTKNFKPKHGPNPPDVRILAFDEEHVLDPDDLDRILPPVADTGGRPPIAPPVGGAGDEPPVRLSSAALCIWKGERPVLKFDGSGQIDRSASLWAIANVLWAHNASRRTIVAALAERDAALGWHRYPDRPAEYQRIAAKVAQGSGQSPLSESRRVVVRVGR